MSRGALVAAVLLGARGHCAHLRLISGPLAGAELPAATFNFTHSSFDVTAAIVLTKATDWMYSQGCPPVYDGSATLSGSLVLHANADIVSCSPESHMVGALNAGALGWMLYVDGWVSNDAVPGHAVYYWEVGDTRRLSNGLAVDISSRHAAPLVAALVNAGSGEAAVRAQLLQSETPGAWDMQRVSWTWWAARISISAHALTVVEVAAFRLLAFLAAEGGPSAGSLFQWLLLVELLTNVARFILFAVDPYNTNGLIPNRAQIVLSGFTMAPAELSSSLFLYHFISAASHAGVGLRVLSRRAGALLLAFVVFAVAFEIVIRLAFVGERMAPGSSMARMLIGALFCPLSIVLGGVWAAVRVRSYLGSLPPAVLRALQLRVHSAIMLHAATFLLSFLLGWGMLSPSWRSTVIWCYCTTAIATSWTIVRTFAPLTTTDAGEPKAPPSGPLERTAVAALRLVSVLLTPLAVLLQGSRPGRRTMPASAGRPGTGGVPSAARKASSLVRLPSASRLMQLSSTRSFEHAPQDSGGANLAQHLLLGVSPEYCRRFAARHKLDRSAPTLAVGALARELTAISRMSLIETIVASGEMLPAADRDSSCNGERSPCARATLFVSHAQTCSFIKLLDAIDAHVAMHALEPSEVYLWLDVFSIRQHEIECDVTHIGQIEQTIGSVVVVLDPWCSPTCLTRMWCLYEIVHAQSHADAQLALTMAPSERSDFLRVMQKEGCAMCAGQLGFDARKASATIESDRVAIFALIAERFGHGRGDDGIELFNSQVRMAIQRALAAFSWAVATAPAPPRALVLGSFTGSRRRSLFPNFAVHPEQPPQSRTALQNTAQTDGADAVTSCGMGALNAA